MMKKWNLLSLFMVFMLTLTACEAGNTEVTTGVQETTTEAASEVTTEDVPEATTGNTVEDKTSKHIIDQYGYYVSVGDGDEKYDGASELEFNLLENTAVDCGDYYTVEAEFLEGIKVPKDVELGDKITVVLDELTGETDVWTYEEGGFSSENEPEHDLAHFYTDDPEEEVYVYRYSDDRVNRLVYRGTLCVRKDAVAEIVVAQMLEKVSEENLNRGGYYHRLLFDENGYVTRLLNIGD